MRTDDLIGALAVDAPSKQVSSSRAMVFALVAGTAMAAIMFCYIWGFRPDLAFAFLKPQFLFKFALVVALAVSSIVLVMRLSRPGAEPGFAGIAVWLVPIAALLGVGYEVLAVPQKFWMDNWQGMNVDKCLTVIPMLSLVPTLLLLAALRYGAPTRPYLAGAVAGLASAAISAALYATYCTSDSAMFVATWYPLAIGAVTFVAAIIGGRVLRW